jgi:hypothetical protein
MVLFMGRKTGKSGVSSTKSIKIRYTYSGSLKKFCGIFLLLLRIRKASHIILPNGNDFFEETWDLLLQF